MAGELQEELANLRRDLVAEFNQRLTAVQRQLEDIAAIVQEQKNIIEEMRSQGREAEPKHKKKYAKVLSKM